MNKSLFIQTLVVATLAVALTWVLRLFPAWQSLDLKSVDVLTVLDPPTLEQTDILLVSIDDASFAELQHPWPWPRNWHGALINRLNNAGAKVIAFDMVLDTPSGFGEADDQRLVEAIAQSVPVVMGAYQQHQNLAEGYQVTSIEPHYVFQDAGVFSADVAVKSDIDGVLRRFPQSEYPFWSEIYYHLSGQDAELASVADNTVHFIGGAGTFPRVSYYRAIDPDLMPDEVFADKVVIVGLDLLAPGEVGVSSFDRYQTPHFAFDGMPMAGFEYHANLLENYRQQLSFAPVKNAMLQTLIIFLALMSAWWFSKWKPITSSAILLAWFAVITGLVWLLLTRNMFTPLLSLLMVPLFSYLAQGGYAYYREYKDKLFITNAFSHYVSPRVLDELIEDPNALSLGGKRKAVTIMFTDLAGFTTLAEQLEAEKVAQILQEHLTMISQIVVDHNGTLDKYIGDAMMAFWGAPLPDANQADNAIQAAIKMQIATQGMSDDLVSKGLPPIAVRIGVHRGEAIVGNMGSNQLFDYTCIGDSVNLSARLESINKYYGTSIMASGDVVASLTDSSALAQIDWVRVKGKSEPVALYTASFENESRHALEQAMLAYQNQDWVTAKEGFQTLIPSTELLSQYCAVMVKRIENIQDGALSLESDGSFTHTEK